MYMSYAEFEQSREVEARFKWSEARWSEIVDTLEGRRADVWMIEPNWYVAPVGEKCGLWDDFIAWMRDRHEDAVSVLGECLRSPSAKTIQIKDYAEARAEFECAKLSACYFVDGE